MKIREVKISLFKSYFDPVPVRSIYFDDFCSCVMEGDYQKEVNAIRRERNKEIRDSLKAKLPAVTISGTFTERKKSCLIKHSELICLDIDSKQNPSIINWQQIVRELSDIINITFAALSVSGHGCFVIIPLAFPERHLEQFNALRSDFRSLGYNIDTACSDVCRLRGMTSDTKAYYNSHAEPYRRIIKNKITNIKADNHTDCLQLINKIISKKVDITSEYKNWYEVGASLAATYGERGRELFHQLSGFYPKYDQKECDKQYDHCLKHPGNYSQATLYYYAEQSGISLKPN
jgi:hypothetical protein